MTIDQGFSLHPGAAQDITEIWAFIAGENPVAARRVREEIMYAVHRLVSFPYQGRRRSDLTVLPLRFISIRDYLIAYAPDKKPLVVIAVFHGRRNPNVLATILHGRE